MMFVLQANQNWEFLHYIQNIDKGVFVLELYAT